MVHKSKKGTAKKAKAAIEDDKVRKSSYRKAPVSKVNPRRKQGTKFTKQRLHKRNEEQYIQPPLFIASTNPRMHGSYRNGGRGK